jgi:hypothetical protein
MHGTPDCLLLPDNLGGGDSLVKAYLGVSGLAGSDKGFTGTPVAVDGYMKDDVLPFLSLINSMAFARVVY